MEYSHSAWDGCTSFYVHFCWTAGAPRLDSIHDFLPVPALSLISLLSEMRRILVKTAQIFAKHWALHRLNISQHMYFVLFVIVHLPFARWVHRLRWNECRLFFSWSKCCSKNFRDAQHLCIRLNRFVIRAMIMLRRKMGRSRCDFHIQNYR